MLTNIELQTLSALKSAALHSVDERTRMAGLIAAAISPSYIEHPAKEAAKHIANRAVTIADAVIERLKNSEQ